MRRSQRSSLAVARCRVRWSATPEPVAPDRADVERRAPATRAGRRRIVRRPPIAARRLSPERPHRQIPAGRRRRAAGARRHHARRRRYGHRAPSIDRPAPRRAARQGEVRRRAHPVRREAADAEGRDRAHDHRRRQGARRIARRDRRHRAAAARRRDDLLRRARARRVVPRRRHGLGRRARLDAHDQGRRPTRRGAAS